MRELLAQIAAESDLDAGTTLVIGAGNGAELPMLRRIGSRRLVLAEAHPQVAAELAARVRAADGEEVWPLAVAPTAAEQIDLKVVSNLRYCSLRDPDRLFAYSPNLRRNPPVRVKARSLADSIRSAVTDLTANNLLVVDAPGLSVELVNSTEAALLQRFAWLIVHASAVPELYQNELPNQRATELLTELGFDPVGEDPDALYPEVVTLYRRNDHRIELSTQSALVASLQAELEKAREAGAWRTQQHQEQLNALRAAHDEVRAELGKTTSVVADLRRQLGEVSAARSELAAGHAALSTARERETQRADRFSKELERQGAVLGASVSERDELRLRLEAMTSEKDALLAQVGELEQQRRSLAESNAELEREVVEQRRRADRADTELESLRADHRDLTEANQALAQTQIEATERQSELQSRLQALGAETTALARDNERLARERHRSDEKAAALQAEVQALQSECSRLEERKRELDAGREEQAKRGANELILSLDRAEQKLSSRQQRIEQLEYELTESSSRQRLLDEELVKAEAQLDLVKDLLLREQTL